MRLIVRRIAVAVTGFALLTSACSGESRPDQIVLLTHDSFAMPEDVLAAFAEESGVEIRVLRGGDAGSMTSQAILTKDNPLADVLFGIDNTFLSRALDEEIFIPYVSPGLDAVDPALVLDQGHRVTPIDFGDVCLNYDKQAFGPVLPVPNDLRDLTDPAYRGMLVVEDPASSSPGLAFLLATIVAFPENTSYTWKEYWADLRDNDVLVDTGWEVAYYGSFSGGSGAGDRPLVVSYASSPPAEVIFADPPVTVAPDRCHHRWLFPPDRVRRNPRRDEGRGCRPRVDRLHVDGEVPERDPPEHVRLPGKWPGDTASGVRRAHGRARQPPVHRSRGHRRSPQ